MTGWLRSGTRRAFLAALAAAAALHHLWPRDVHAAYLAARHGEIYRQIGLRPLINAAGSYTTLTGSVVPAEVRRAMAEASQCFVPLIDLQQAAGRRIADLLGVEAALVTSGAAGAILLATAACVTRGDPELVRRIPDTAGMKNEVVMVKQHRMGFDHAARAAGVKIVEADTVEELRAVINPRTAMLFYVHTFETRGKIGRKEFLAAGKKADIPVFNDAAAELPPVENLWEIVNEGFDLVAFSGGKSMRGPQASGLLLGRKDLIEAAGRNNNPYADTIGRAMKVGKEEIMGLVKAVEVYASRDHEADQKLRHALMERIAKELRGLPSVRTEIYIPGPGGRPLPFLRVQWDESRVALSYAECAARLREGEPSIEVNTAGDEITLSSQNLFPGEDRITGWRLREILRDAARITRGTENK
jgi:D-glucosaminate-6-phosphate ammonia-lyase